MNHYERLKVAQDAPAEVIRAAYRALATKLHPDRQGPGNGQLDSVHEEMAALNAAYEILIDPKLRADYDATLVMPSRGGRVSADAGMGATTGAASAFRPEEEDAFSSSRVDLDWLKPKASAEVVLWPPSRRMTLVGGAVGVLLLGLGGAWLWQLASEHQMDEALSHQYRAHGAAPHPSPWQQASVGAAAAAPGEMPGGGRRPTVEELSRMSDEELLRALPTLDGQARAPDEVPVAGGRSLLGNSGPHPLDGTPLVLRSDRELIDPLAPDVPPGASTATAAASVP